MASRRREPFTNVDPETEEDARRRGIDPHDLDSSTEHFMSLMYSSLPDQPVYSAAHLTADCSSPSDGIDRISDLPSALIRDIVSRLPAKDAARTAVLGTCWRGAWRSAPLVLVDTHLSDGIWPPTDSPSVVAAVSRVLAAHPGPFRCVHLVCSRMGGRQTELRRWLRLLAAKGVQELVLVNRPWPIKVPLPRTLFTISTLTRLYIGVWKFPDATGLRGVSFPHLRELGLCIVTVESGDIETFVAKSPVLEILNIQGNIQGLRLWLVSNSLRCVQICASEMETIAVVNTPCLERLILSGSMNSDCGLCTRVKIGNAPKLRLFGYLEAGKYTLEIRDTVIKAGIEPTPSMMLTTVKILSFDVCFGVQKDIEMMPTFLRCFPNVETLHIKSADCDHPTGELNLRFWEDQAGPIISVMFRIRVMTFSEFRGEHYELSFLQCFFESAGVLKYAVIAMVDPRFTSLSMDEMISSVQNMSDEKWASKFNLALCRSSGEGSRLCTFEQGADFSDEDPFSPVEIPSKF
uniref:Uncharacterized protein n=1 Tax=Avena sativa TaxID=4498 RepID=A0ACD5VT76_AVESA